MAEYQRKTIPFLHRGMNWNSAVEKIPEGQLPWAKNVRVLAQGTVTSAHGYTVARGLDGASFSPLGIGWLHSFSRLNINNPGFDAALTPMYITGGDTSLWAFNKNNTLLSASLNPLHTPLTVGAGNQYNVFSGNPLSIVDAQPAGATVSWKYIGDSQQMVTVGYYPKVNAVTGGTGDTAAGTMARCLTVGLLPPVHSNQLTINAGAGLLNGNYSWMFAYRRVPTGARSNPSAPLRASSTAQFITLSNNSVSIPLPAAPIDPQTGAADGNVVVDIYRFGGTIFRWALVGSQAGGTTFWDNTQDINLLAAPSPPQTVDPATGQSRFNLFQPFVTQDIAHSGIAAVSVTSDGSNRWFLTDQAGSTPFNVNWLPGSTIYVTSGSGATSGTTFAFTIYQVLSPTSLELAQSGSGLLGSSDPVDKWFVPAGTLMSGQPMAHLWGSYGLGQTASYLFACGDPNGPGTLYWTNGNDPDSTDIVNNIVITAPGEKLVTGCIYDGQPYVWTTERQFQIFPSLTVFGQFTAQEVAGAKGVWLEWSLSVQSNGISDQSVTWRGKDGIYDWSTGAGLRRLTDDLYSFFPHDNASGLAPETILPYIGARPARQGDPNYLPDRVGNLDDTQPRYHRTCWFHGMLFYDFVAQISFGAPALQPAALAAGGTLVVGTPYYYVVTALDSTGGETTQSSEVTATPTTGNQTINLTWKPVDSAASYRVYRSTASGSYLGPSLAGSPTGTSFSDTGVALAAGRPPSQTSLGAPTSPAAALAAGGALIVGTAEYYVITALDSTGGESIKSLEVTATPTTGNQTINLTWTAVTNAVSYKVYRSTTSGSYGATSLVGNPTATSLSDTGIALSAGMPPTSAKSTTNVFSCLVWDDVQVKGWVSLDQPFGSPAIPDTTKPVARAIEIGASNLKLTRADTIYDYYGTSKGFASRIITRAEDMGDPRLNKLYGDYWLDCTPVANNVTVGLLRDFHTLALNTPEFLNTASQRTTFALEFRDTIASGGKGLMALSLGLDIHWTDPASQFGSVFYQWQPSFILKPESIAFRISDRTSEGVVGAKYLMGMNVEANTFNTPYPLTVIIDGLQVAVLTITHDGQTIKPYAWTPVAGYEFQVELQLQANLAPAWQLFGIRWIFEAWPDAVARTYPFQDLGGSGVKYIRGVELPIETGGVSGTVGLLADDGITLRQFSGLTTSKLLKTGTVLDLVGPIIAHQIQFSTLTAMRIWPDQAKIDFEPWPELSNEVSPFTDCGYRGSKFMQGAIIPMDTNGKSVQLQIRYDCGNFVALPPTTTSPNCKMKVAFSFSPCNNPPSDPFLATEVQVQPLGDARVWFDEIEWIFEPAPELATTWDTQPTDHDIPGWHSLRDCYIAYQGGAGAPKLTITTEYGSISYTLDAVTGSQYTRCYRVLQPQKARWRSYRVEGCGAFRLYKRDCSVNIKAWGSTGPFTAALPFGGPSRADGARI